MKSLFKFTSVLIVLALVLSACAPKTAAPVEPAGEQPAAGGETVVVGLVMKSLANEFFKVMQEATVAWAGTRPDIELIPVGMNSETDIDTQFAAVEKFVTQGVDLIVVAAADSVGMVAPVKKAVDAGITVVNFDVKLDTAALKQAGLPEDFLFVGPDNAEGAKLAGDALAQALGKGGKVIIIEGNPGADNATQRKNGFLQSVEEGGLELLDSKTAHWETEEANTVVSNLLVKYPDVQGIMCANDSMALGAVKAVEAAGLTGKVLIVGFDNIPAVQELIKEGKILASVDQFGPDMAKNAIEVGLRILNGEKLGGWIKTPVQLVDAETFGGAAVVPVAQETVVVGLVMKSLANEFFKVMQEATVAWAGTRPDIELIPVGMNSETDIDTQFAAVEKFVTQDVDLIVVAAADSVGMVAPVKKAVAAGITVVNFDVKLDTAALKQAGLPEDFLFVGPDNAEGAKLAGDALAQALGKGGKVIIIEGNPGADNATQRKNGFLQSVEEGGLELLDSKTAHWETEEANTVVSNLLVKYPDVQGIMCANDSMALGAVKAVEAAGLTGKVLIVGFDNIPAVQELIKEGKILASVDQFGPDMAKNAIEVGLRILNGEKLGGWIKTPVRLVTADDL
jgi:ribose transport system substrate-binding protein